MRVVKLWGTMGAVVGVICGCLLGMTQLLVIDLEKSDRLKKAAELDSMFKSVRRGQRMKRGRLGLGAGGVRGVRVDE